MEHPFPFHGEQPTHDTLCQASPQHNHIVVLILKFKSTEFLRTILVFRSGRWRGQTSEAVTY